MFLFDLKDGSSIFIDANIFIYHFCRKSRFNPVSSDFLERAEGGKINGITSTSVILEVTHRIVFLRYACSAPASPTTHGFRSAKHTD